MVKDDFKIAYDSGCFGNGDLIKTKKGMLYTRALNETLSAHPTIEDDLEKLAGLKNEHIARIKDYKFVDMGSNQPPLVMTISEGYNRRLSQHLQSLDEVLPVRRYVNWCYQAGKGVSYLLVQGIYHKLLSTRTCLLDMHGNIKLCDFWTRTDFVKISQNEYWRALPPETLMDNVLTTDSLIWTFSHLIWQIFTHSTLLYRAKFNTMADFVTYSCKDDEFYLPGTIDLTEFESGDRNLFYRLAAFNGLCGRFPRAPESFNRFVRNCLSSEVKKRPTWSELLSILGKEQRIFKLSFVAEFFNCS